MPASSLPGPPRRERSHFEPQTGACREAGSSCPDFDIPGGPHGAKKVEWVRNPYRGACDRLAAVEIFRAPETGARARSGSRVDNDAKSLFGTRRGKIPGDCVEDLVADGTQ